jgi:hypothetical protein
VEIWCTQGTELNYNENNNFRTRKGICCIQPIKMIFLN